MDKGQETARIAVVERNELWRGGIVRVKVPEVVMHGEFQNGANKLSYFVFHRPVPGGHVKLFVHLRNEADRDCRGKRIKVAVAVMSKVLENGQEYLHVNLVPVHSTTEVTHRLVVMPLSAAINDAWQVFPTPAPLRGMIILTPPDAKIDQ